MVTMMRLPVSMTSSFAPNGLDIIKVFTFSRDSKAMSSTYSYQYSMEIFYSSMLTNKSLTMRNYLLIFEERSFLERPSI